jgi:hypothetical protein
MDCLPQIHTIAIHAEPGYRGFVPGLGVFCREDDWTAGGGRFQNSFALMSSYLALGYQPWRVGSVRLGALGGIIDGYPINNGEVMPLAAGLASMALSWGEAHLIVNPLITHSTPLIMQLSFSFRYK